MRVGDHNAHGGRVFGNPVVHGIPFRVRCLDAAACQGKLLGVFAGVYRYLPAVLAVQCGAVLGYSAVRYLFRAASARQRVTAKNEYQSLDCLPHQSVVV